MDGDEIRKDFPKPIVILLRFNNCWKIHIYIANHVVYNDYYMQDEAWLGMIEDGSLYVLIDSKSLVSLLLDLVDR